MMGPTSDNATVPHPISVQSQSYQGSNAPPPSSAGGASGDDHTPADTDDETRAEPNLSVDDLHHHHTDVASDVPTGGDGAADAEFVKTTEDGSGLTPSFLIVNVPGPQRDAPTGATAPRRAARDRNNGGNPPFFGLDPLLSMDDGGSDVENATGDETSFQASGDHIHDAAQPGIEVASPRLCAENLPQGVGEGQGYRKLIVHWLETVKSP